MAMRYYKDKNIKRPRKSVRETKAAAQRIKLESRLKEISNLLFHPFGRILLNFLHSGKRALTNKM